jgi:hypothetical protein
MKGSQESLTTAVVKDAANWPTPKANDPEKRGDFNPLDHRTGLLGAVKLQQHGPAAPANPSTDGSRQGLWRTPSVAEEKNQNTSTQIYLQNQVGATPKAWATPRSGKTTDENPETWALRQAKGDVATMPLTAQVKAWATPIQGDSHLASTPEVARKRIEEGKVTLSRQNLGKLNPRWVETLMGLPIGWVMPSCASPVTIAPTSCDSSVMESCLQQQSELFEC